VVAGGHEIMNPSQQRWIDRPDRVDATDDVDVHSDGDARRPAGALTIIVHHC